MIKRAFLTGMVVVVVLGLAAPVYLFAIYPRIKQQGTGMVHEFTVPKGFGPKRLANVLESAGVLSSPRRFALWMRGTGGMPRVKAGRFGIRDDLAPAEILERLGEPIKERGTRVTIPEGYNLGQIGESLEKAGIVSAAEFLQFATSHEVASELGIQGRSVEGYLFPDTYFLDASFKPVHIIRMMHDNFKENLDALGIPLGGTLNNLVTLASIVQAETGISDEMPIVAGVYRNRLSNLKFPSRLLQADPTVSYGCQPFVKPRPKSCTTFKGIIGRRQLDDDTNPYNTYRYSGLPPGPICAPGTRALQAAHKPAQVPYLFFVAGEGGRHVFSQTLEEHNKAVDAYRRR
jgi:UPF0755 protein